MIARVVKARSATAGLNPANYSGRSLRAGLATSVTLAGHPGDRLALFCCATFLLVRLLSAWQTAVDRTSGPTLQNCVCIGFFTRNILPPE